MSVPLISTSLRRVLTGISLAAISILLLLHFVVSPVQVEGSSMLPTLAPTQRLLISPLVAKLGLNRYDIVVIRHPRHPGQSMIKRIIGLPGEKIEITDSGIRINGVRLAGSRKIPQGNPGSIRIPADHYFVLGDNFRDSLDSRAFGPVPSSWIRGKAVFRYWPFSRLGIPR